MTVRWKHDKEQQTLTYKGYYEIDLESITTAHDVLDWIIHCSEMSDMDDAAIGELVRELSRVMNIYKLIYPKR